MADARELYDQDFNLWAQETAAALRAGRWVAVDVEHVAEEIEDLAKRNKRELQSRLTQILEHLLKLRLEKGRSSITTAGDGRRRSGGSAPRSRACSRRARASDS